jgi:hypothetical protein
MQEPLFRVRKPYPAQGQSKKTVPASRWTHPYRLYVSVSLYIFGMSIFYFFLMASNTSSSPFISENIGFNILQLMAEFLVFLFLFLWGIRKKRSSSRRGRKSLFQGERSITRHVLLAYTVVTVLLLIGALWLDFGRMHYWQGIFLVLDVALPFIVVLWGPSMLLHRKAKYPPKNVKTSFTDFQRYLPEGDAGR